jgi:plasmid replication initiation protein
MMGVPESYTWQKFQTRVMETAKTELWEKSNISVTFERVKTGRKITHLNIKFIEDSQQKLPL